MIERCHVRAASTLAVAAGLLALLECAGPRAASPPPVLRPAPRSAATAPAAAPPDLPEGAANRAALPLVSPSQVLRPGQGELDAHPWLAGQTMGTTPLLDERALLAAGGAADWMRGDPRARVRAVASVYRAWGRVDDELRWAPYLCRMPMPSRPAFSTAEQGSPHGQKLYFLYARDRTAYVGRAAVPDGQVIVKESWMPHAIDPARAVQVQGIPITAPRDGRTYEPGQFAGLYMMIRVPRGTPESDEGWIYGTATADGTVTAAGRVASCIGCHEQAGPDRLFGLRMRVARGPFD